VVCGRMSNSSTRRHMEQDMRQGTITDIRVACSAAMQWIPSARQDMVQDMVPDIRQALRQGMMHCMRLGMMCSMRRVQRQGMKLGIR